MMIRPTDPTTADPGTIPISDKMKQPVDLNTHLPAGAAAADYRLESRKESVFTVAAKKSTSGVLSTSVWEVTPVSKGTAKAEIVGKTDGKVAATLTVIVENRAPGLKATRVVPTSPLSLEGPTAHARPTGNTTPTLTNENNGNVLNLYHVSLNASGQFKDPDADENVAGKLTYKITSSRDDVIVQDGSACTTATTATCKVWVDIAARRTGVDEFNLNVVAKDSDMATSASVSFPISMEDPASQMYNVEQYRADGDFRSIAVGYRATTEHELVFKHPVDAMFGFLFAEELIKNLKAIKDIETSATQLVDAVETNDPGGFIPKGGTEHQTIFYGTSSPPSLAHLDQVDVTDFVGPDGDAND